MIVISDTSPLSSLIQIDKLRLLSQLYKKIIVPPTVHIELSKLTQFGVNLSEYHAPDWITISKPVDIIFVKKLEKDLDKRESEAIAIAQELKADLLLIDERLGTKHAKALGLNTIGLMGVLVQAKNKGIVTEIKPLIEDLENNETFKNVLKRYLLNSKNIPYAILLNDDWGSGKT